MRDENSKAYLATNNGNKYKAQEYNRVILENKRIEDTGDTIGNLIAYIDKLLKDKKEITRELDKILGELRNHYRY